jgi:hypothetical protein
VKIKKVLVEVNKGFSPHRYIYTIGTPTDTECDFRVNVFYGGGRYFFFYSGLFKKRRLKRNTWFLELILNRGRLEREKAGKEDEEHVTKPLRILEGVEREEGRYVYEKMYVSAYLMRRLLEGSTRPDTIKELEVYES